MKPSDSRLNPNIRQYSAQRTAVTADCEVLRLRTLQMLK